MTARLGITILLVAAAATITAAQGPTTAATQSAMLLKLRTLADDLRKNAESWKKQEPETNPAEGTLRTTEYDLAAVADLKKVVAAVSEKDRSVKDPATFYVIHKLLSQLATAKPEVIREALPTVREFFNNRNYGYRPLPHYSDQQIKDMFLMPANPKGLTPQALLKKIDDVQKRRADKEAKEMPIVGHDQLVAQFSRLYFTLMVLADDPKTDLELIKLIPALEKKGNLAFHWAMECLAAQAPKLTQDRAKKFYTFLSKWGEDNRYERRAYLEYSNPLFDPAGNSTCTMIPVYLGFSALTYTNQLAPVAKEPAVVVPTGADIDKYIAEHQPKPRR